MEKIVSLCKEWFQEYRPEGTLLNQLLWIVWAVWVILILIAVVRVIRFRICLAREDKIWGDGSGPQKTAVVIVPIKGVTPRHTSDFFQSLLEQNYSSYRIIVTVETSDDPAAEWLCDQFGLTLSNPIWAPKTPKGGLQTVQLVVAGKSKGQGQKVHNELAAFAELTADDEIISFVDADIVCPPDWLAKLTCPINRGSADPTTTYRWLVPAKIRLANLFASVINASVTTQGGNVRENMPWGGSMAISRATFDKLNVPALFEGSVNDDLRLGKAAKKAGYRVTYIRNLVRPTEVDFTWGKFFEFARRQYLQVKVFAPILYTSANFVYGFYVLGFISVVVSIVMGNLWAWIPLLAATILDQIRASTRESIYRRLFGNDPDTYKKISRTSMVEHFLTPLFMGLHGLIIMSTWFMNKMEWGGVSYQVESPQKTRVLGRKAVESNVDLSTIGQLALPAGGLFPALADAYNAGVGSVTKGEGGDTATLEGAGDISISDLDEEPVESADEDKEIAVTHESAADTPELVLAGGEENAWNDSTNDDFGPEEVQEEVEVANTGEENIADELESELFNTESDGAEDLNEEIDSPVEPEIEDSGFTHSDPETAPDEKRLFTFIKLGSTAAAADEEVEQPSTETEDSAIPVGATEFFVVQEELEIPEVEDESDSVQESFVEEPGELASADPEVFETVEASESAVSAVPRAPSAVVLLGKGLAGSVPSGRFTPPWETPYYLQKKVATERTYLAKWEKLTQHQRKRMKRGK